MADIAARDELTPGGAARPGGAGRSDTDRREPGNQPPRTDVGTLVLHWTTAVAFLVSLFTGIRIAADAINAPVSRWLNPILPQGEIWTWHFLAGLSLFFCAAAYAIYTWRAALANRNALKKTRVMVMPVSAKMRFGGLNVALHWAAYLIIGIMTVTGIFLYLGWGGWLISVHSYTAFVGLAYIFIHIIAHYLHGGWWQVFRIFRPAKLVLTAAVKPKPLLIAAAVGVVVIAGIAATDWATRDTLIITKVDAEPKLDGVFDEPLWSKARPVTIHTQQGENFGGPGESTVEVRAVHNGQKVFFAFKWSDPTRSLRRVPTGQEGGRLAHRHARRHDGRDRFLRGQARDHLLRQAGHRRRGRLEPWSRSPARRQAEAAQRARLPLHHRRLIRRHVAVEGLAWRHARPHRRPVHRSAARRERRTRPRIAHATKAATGTIPAAPTTPTTTSPS